MIPINRGAIPINRAQAQALEPLIRVACDALSSPHSKRNYRQALEQFLAWFQASACTFNRQAVQQWKAELEASGKLAPASINLRLAAVRKLAAEAADNGWLDAQIAAGILRIKGVRGSGARLGNWLSKPQVEKLVSLPDTSTLKGLRDRALLLVMLGTGLRRAEVSSLSLTQVQMRENRWVIVDLKGKGNQTRSVPMPHWAKTAIDRYAGAAGLDATPGGRLFRPIGKGKRGQVTGDRLSNMAIRKIVTQYGKKMNMPTLGPHDLRRSFARLADKGRAPLSQIQKSLGHASIDTTQIYLGDQQDFTDAPCDHLGLDIEE